MWLKAQDMWLKLDEVTLLFSRDFLLHFPIANIKIIYFFTPIEPLMFNRAVVILSCGKKYKDPVSL